MRHGTGMVMLGALCTGLIVGCGQSTAPETAGPPVGASPAVSTSAAPATSQAGASQAAALGDSPLHSSPTASRQALSEPRVASPVPPLAADAEPDAVITAFLEATRRGDDQLAASLLSQKALEETSRIGLAVKPPGTPSMEYQIAEVEYAEEISDGAYVHSTWTEQFEGVEEEFEVTWVLRRETEGWRIVGMAAELQPGDPPFFLNFEEPSELYRQMQEFVDDSPPAVESDADSEQLETARQPEPSIYGSSEVGHLERR